VRKTGMDEKNRKKLEKQESVRKTGKYNEKTGMRYRKTGNTFLTFL